MSSQCAVTHVAGADLCRLQQVKQHNTETVGAITCTLIVRLLQMTAWELFLVELRLKLELDNLSLF